MAQGHRPDRVGDQIRQELSDLLARGAVHDPGIGFITFTRVKVTPDLQLARVYYTIDGRREARRETAQGARARHARSSAGTSARRLQLRRVPELEFRFDESIANQDRIEQILRDLHAEEAQRAAAGAASRTLATGRHRPTRRRADAGSESPTTPHADHRD